MRKLCQLMRRVLDFYLEPANAEMTSDPAKSSATAAVEAASGAGRLQDLPWGAEFKEVLLKHYPHWTDEQIEEALRQF